MNCEDLNEALVDLVDGRLDARRTAQRRAASRGLRELPRAGRRSAHDPRRRVHARSARAEGRDVVGGADRDRCGACAARAGC